MEPHPPHNRDLSVLSFLARTVSSIGSSRLLYAFLLAGLSGAFAPGAWAQVLIVDGHNTARRLTEGDSTQYEASFVSASGDFSGTRVVRVSANSSAVTVSPTELTFTSSNFLTPQVVTVTAVDDDVVNGGNLFVGRRVTLTFRSGSTTYTPEVVR